MKQLLLIFFVIFAHTQASDAEYTVDLPPLHDAVCKNDIDKIKSLLESGVDVDEKDDCGETALLTALEICKPECARLLINSHANANATTNGYWATTPLYYAARNNDNETIKLLVDAGADIPAAIECANKYSKQSAKALLTGLLAIPQ